MVKESMTQASDCIIITGLPHETVAVRPRLWRFLQAPLEFDCIIDLVICLDDGGSSAVWVRCLAEKDARKLMEHISMQEGVRVRYASDTPPSPRLPPPPVVALAAPVQVTAAAPTMIKSPYIVDADPTSPPKGTDNESVPANLSFAPTAGVRPFSIHFKLCTRRSSNEAVSWLEEHLEDEGVQCDQGFNVLSPIEVIVYFENVGKALAAYDKLNNNLIDKGRTVTLKLQVPRVTVSGIPVEMVPAAVIPSDNTDIREQLIELLLYRAISPVGAIHSIEVENHLSSAEVIFETSEAMEECLRREVDFPGLHGTSHKLMIKARET